MLRREGDLFYFTHASWYEFFLGNAIINSINIKNKKLLSKGVLSLNVTSFISDSISYHHKKIDWDWWFEELDNLNSNCIRNIIKILEIMKHNYLLKFIPRIINNGSQITLIDAVKIAGYSMVNIESYLNKLIKNKNWIIKYLIIELCGLKKIESCNQEIINFTKSRNPHIKRISLWSLRKIRSNQLNVHALNILKSFDDRKLKAACIILGYNQYKKALPFLKFRLKSKLIKGDNAQYVKEAIEAIESKIEIDWKTKIDEIINNPNNVKKILKDRRKNWQRRYLIELIGETQSNRLNNLLRDIYDFEDVSFKNTIIDALGESRDPENTIFFINKFFQETNNELRFNLLWALGNSRDTRAITTINNALSEHNELIRNWAIWALKQFRPFEKIKIDMDEYVYPLS